MALAVIGDIPYTANLMGPPYLSGVALTPHNSDNAPKMFRGIYVGVSTTDSQAIAVVMSDGVVLTFQNVKQGQILPVVGVRVNSTGTTASGLIGLF